MNDYGRGNFAPSTQLSCAQLAQILFNKEGRPGVDYLMEFSDVSGEAWYAKAIRWATSQGIVSGFGNGTFGPNDPITREQLAEIILDSIQKTLQKGFVLEPGDPDTIDIWYYSEETQPLKLPNLGLSWPVDQPYQWAGAVGK